MAMAKRQRNDGNGALVCCVSWFFSTVQEPADPSHLALGVQLVSVLPLPTNCPDPDPDFVCIVSACHIQV